MNNSDKNYFCTLFDANYLAKGVAMLRSLKKYCLNPHVYVLCMDEETKSLLHTFDFSYVTCLTLGEIEDQELLAIKPTRNSAEYCWTLSPCLPWFVLQNYAHVDFITYLDADLYFYSDVQPIIDEIGDSSIAIIEHRFVPELQHLVNRGRFCVEWVSFRRDKEGLACLNRWREQCIEWCFYRLEENRMGDQKYLDSWPNLYENICILQSVGAGIAPWNYVNYKFSEAGGVIRVDGAPLIFYHFHQFQILSYGRFDRLSRYYTKLGKAPSAVYFEYEKAISSIMNELKEIRPGFRAGVKPYFRIKAQRVFQFIAPEWLKHSLKRIIRAV